MWIAAGLLIALFLWLKTQKTVPEDQWCSGVVGGPAVWDPKAPAELTARVARSHNVVAAAKKAEHMLVVAVDLNELPDDALDRLVVLLTIAGMLCGVDLKTAAETAAEHATMVIYSGPLRWVAASRSAARVVSCMESRTVDPDAELLCKLASELMRSPSS